jgi:hypothetical protein
LSHQEECQEFGGHEESCVAYILLANEKPQHGVCPNGGDSWCKFKNSASSGVAYEHKHSLPAVVMDAIKPVLRDLAGVDPLKKCFYGKIHNPNESLNSIIWTSLPKLFL